MAIALYPGAFKPPHRGHFELVKSLINNNHNGRIYDKTSIDSVVSNLGNEDESIEKIDKVIIFLGGGERNGISLKESKAVWDTYLKHIPGVEVIVGDKNPMLAAKDYAKENPDQTFYAVTGFRDESDVKDLARITTFKNRPNVKGLVISSKPENLVRATNFRKALLSGNLDEVKDFFPKELSNDEILKIMNMLKQSIISEIMQEDVDKLFDSWFSLDENSGGTPVAPSSVIRSSDRSELVRLYNRLIDMIGDNYYNIDFNQDHIRISTKGKDNSKFDYTPYMGSILEYMIEQGMKIQPLPEIKIKRDLVEASDFFGKTAYYKPDKKEVVVYTQSRHPKDVMRSFTHEMVHHMQNIEGRLGSISTYNTNESNELLEIEKEAYLLGNITFRNWEDKVKNSK